MFRDAYHRANDSIPINNELLEKIKNTEPKKHKTFYPHAMVAASVLIVSAVVIAYPKVKITNEEPVRTPAIEVVYTEENPVVSEPEIMVTEPPVQEKQEIKAEEKAVEKAVENKEVKQDKKEAAAEIQKQTDKPAAETPKPYPEELKQKQLAEAEAKAAAVTSVPESRIAVTVPEKQGEVLGATSDEVKKEELITETWTTGDYFEYLGREVTPHIPADLKDVTPAEKNMTVYAETGEPYFDSWTLKYESENKDRTVSLKLSKSEEQIPQNNLKTDDGINKQAEVVNNGVLCNVKTSGLTDEEFSGLCDSI